MGSVNGIEADPRAPDTRAIRMLNECDVNLDGDGVYGASSKANDEFFTTPPSSI